MCHPLEIKSIIIIIIIIIFIIIIIIIIIIIVIIIIQCVNISSTGYWKNEEWADLNILSLDRNLTKSLMAQFWHYNHWIQCCA